MKSRSSNVAGGLGIPDPATPQLECQACHSSRATCGVVAGGTGAPPSEIRGKVAHRERRSLVGPLKKNDRPPGGDDRCPT